MSERRSLRVVITAIFISIAAAVGARAYSFPPVPVEGDREMLDYLHDVQVSNVGKYPRGAMALEYTYSAGGKMEWDGTAEVIWEDKNRYYKLDFKSEVENSKSLEVVWTPEKLILWNKGRSYLEVLSEGRGRDDTTLVRLHPSGSWYTIGLSANRTWDTLLDASGNQPWTPVVPKIVVHSEGEFSIVEWYYEHGLSAELKFSNAVGGNLVRFHTRPGDPGAPYYAESCEYQWVADGLGGWRLADLVWISAGGPPGGPVDAKSGKVRDGITPYHEVHLAITKFDPDPKIAPDRFTLESLNVTPGSRIVERGLKSYRLSKQAGDVTIQLNIELDDLANEIRSRGFAAPR